MDYKNWLIQQIASETSVPESEVDCDALFENMNLDSLSIVSISFEMESVFQLENMDPTIFTEHNSINKLCAWLENQ